MNNQHDYKKIYKQIKTEISKPKQTVEVMEQMIKTQQQMNEKLQLSVADLKCKLGQYDNFNTLSSMKKRSSTSGTGVNNCMSKAKCKPSKMSGKNL